jgi:FkbM family methyltransferase
VVSPRLRSTAKRFVPSRARYWLHVSLCAVTSLTIRDRELVANARSLGSRPCRVLGGDLRGKVLCNPVGQTSPAHVLGHFESQVADTMHESVHAGDTVYDIGANVGWHTLRLSTLVGPTGAVHSFEPTPGDRRLLEMNLGANDVANVVVDPRALSHVEGSVRFATFSSPGVNHVATGSEPADARFIEVEATTLDAYVFDQRHDPPTFIKMDVEGGELDVLLGAERLFSACRPVLVAEVRRDERWPQMVEFFERHRYRQTQLNGDDDLADVLFTPQ